MHTTSFIKMKNDTVDKTRILFRPEIYTQEEVHSKCPNFLHKIDIIDSTSINIENHFGALVSFNIFTRDCAVYGGRNDTVILGFLFRYFSNFFSLPYDGCERSHMEDLKGKKVQYFLNPKGQVIFLGNEKGQFIEIDDVRYLRYSQAEGELLKEKDRIKNFN